MSLELQRLQAAGPDAFTEPAGDRVVKHAHRLTGNLPVAEDAMSEPPVAWRSRTSHDAERGPAAGLLLATATRR